MNKAKSVFFLSLIFLAFIFSCGRKEQYRNIVWFDNPAKYFEEAFPLGNGFIGMMVKGGVPSEDLILNESSLWTGGPVNPYMNPDAWKNLEGVRKAFLGRLQTCGTTSPKNPGQILRIVCPTGKPQDFI